MNTGGKWILKEFISASELKDMILCADAALHANMQIINELNVFPVPDGDTGTNMSLTVNNAATELRQKDFINVADVASTAASGMLRGARGNSGVITSLLFRGLSKSMKGLETVDAAQFSKAMQAGVDAAYKAVMKPAEGTILTVSRKAAEAAVSYTNGGGTDIEEMLDVALEAGRVALDDTMNQNPVLLKAGVIDAGGKGYITIYDAMLKCLRGEAEAPVSDPATSSEEESVFEKFDSEDIEFAYDTVFIVRKTVNKDLDLLRAYLDSIGDSLVIGEDDECFKVHVHTNVPGNALNEAQNYGTLETAKIENMRTQHDELVENGLPAAEPVAPAEPEKEFGSVAVCAGEGLAELFRELGVDTIVTGGQTMNPSTDDILKEINKTNAKTVFVLPNNKNIIMAAQQCGGLTEKKVVVIPTKTVPQGISAMLCFDPDQSEDSIVSTMEESIKRVHTAQITYAARDSEFDGHSIKEGEYLALLDGALVGSYTAFDEMLKSFVPSVEKLDMDPELITLYYGENVSEEDANATGETLGSFFPDAEVSVVYGGQPIYYYMISIE